MGSLWFTDNDKVTGHIDYSDYCFRFFIWTVYFRNYIGPSFYIDIPIIKIDFYLQGFLEGSWGSRWLDIKHLFYIDTYEKMIEPGTYHIIWFFFERWYKKNKKNKNQ